MLAARASVSSGKLVLSGYELNEISEDSTPLTNGDSVGPRVTGGNSGFSVTKYYDDCSHAGGLAFPFDDYEGYVAINDCFVTLCLKSRGSNTASACAEGDCVSQTASDTGGFNRVYELVESPGDVAVVFFGYDPMLEYPCSCQNGVVTLNSGFSSCKIGGQWDAIENFQEGQCAYRDIGEDMASLGCSQTASGTFAAKASGVTVILAGVAMSLM